MEKLKISDELLDYVLTDNLQTFKVDKIENNILYYFWLNNGFFGEGESYYKWEKKSINIYELADMCKEWIIKKEYQINTRENRFNNYLCLYKRTKSVYGYVIDTSKGVQFDSKGYITNLFEACEWILVDMK